MGLYHGMPTRVQREIYEIEMRDESGNAYGGYYYTGSRKEAIARAYREFKECKLVRVITEDRMSENDKLRARDALGLPMPPMKSANINWSALDLY